MHGTYWECLVCKCSFSGYTDMHEMRDHYTEDHPEISQRELIDKYDLMQRKVNYAGRKNQRSSEHSTRNSKNGGRKNSNSW